MKFKPGDKVRVIIGFPGLPPGTIRTVKRYKETNPKGVYTYVSKLDDLPENESGYFLISPYSESDNEYHFEKVVKKSKNLPDWF
jgi:hypothetical protein